MKSVFKLLAAVSLCAAACTAALADAAIITQALVLFAIDSSVVQIVPGALILWAVGINRMRGIRVAKHNEAR
jgi:ribose transport system permease protein